MANEVTKPTEQLVNRVRKLLDKAEATDNVHEAEAFSLKAAELVAHHRIAPERLAARRRVGDALGIVEINLARGAYVRGRLALLVAIADAHDVRVVFRPTPEGTIAYAAGHGDDLAIVEMTYVSLHQQAAAQMATIKRSTGAATQRYRRSFLFGFAERIGEILADARGRVEASAAAAVVPATAVALQARAERVDRFVDESWGRVRAAGAPSSVLANGWRSGANAAQRADLGRPRVGGRWAIGRG